MTVPELTMIALLVAAVTLAVVAEFGLGVLVLELLIGLALAITAGVLDRA